MTNPIKFQFGFTQLVIVLANLIPLYGVWFLHWQATDIFLVYCMESIIIGAYNFLQMWLTTLIKKKDVWHEETGYKSLQSGYLFMFFFLFHYGFFIALQLFIFFGIMSIGNQNMPSVFEFLTNCTKYLPNYGILLLFVFTISHGLVIAKEYILTQYYKTANLSKQMFMPYGRIILQQFMVIVGSIILLFDTTGKLFILFFVLIKIFMECFIDFKKLVDDTKKKV